ncbi:MAG: ABC transporter ATP-binding protein [Hyphomicrobiaceae bacterium]|nr:ABC transporter ATP-binding protein [Hyphomicrobiaceae bacterium]
MTLVADRVSIRLGSRLAVVAASLELDAGQIVAVVGPNGAGKSTLLRGLAGLQRVTEGSVRLDGVDIASFAAAALARRIAFMPQARMVHWPLAVARVVALGRLPHRGTPGGAAASDTSAIDEALATMDLAALAGRTVTELSGGELARVLLARALAQQADILIADEPTAGLDLAHVIQLFEHLRRIASGGRLVVVALHDLSLALRYCDQTILLNRGSILAAGSSRDVITAEHIAEAFGVAARVATLDHVPIVLAGRTLT